MQSHCPYHFVSFDSHVDTDITPNHCPATQHEIPPFKMFPATDSEIDF